MGRISQRSGPAPQGRPTCRCGRCQPLSLPAAAQFRLDGGTV